jgi:hypothetical protein
MGGCNTWPDERDRVVHDRRHIPERVDQTLELAGVHIPDEL